MQEVKIELGSRICGIYGIDLMRLGERKIYYLLPGN